MSQEAPDRGSPNGNRILRTGVAVPAGTRHAAAHLGIRRKPGTLNLGPTGNPARANCTSGFDETTKFTGARIDVSKVG